MATPVSPEARLVVVGSCECRNLRDRRAEVDAPRRGRSAADQDRYQVHARIAEQHVLELGWSRAAANRLGERRAESGVGIGLVAGPAVRGPHDVDFRPGRQVGRVGAEYLYRYPRL